MSYQPIIGLEIHAELNTKTKMFCDCRNDPDEHHPNILICPICAGHPGTLPAINKAAVEAVLKTGMALNGEIPQFSKFDRKNYFYPDLPKGYQISQYDLPLVVGGNLNNIRLRRIHLEEDTARLLHGARSNDEQMKTNKKRIFDKNSISFDKDSGASYVDYNRAGVPLMELVTEPDIRSAEQAAEFAQELQLILRYLGVSDADMEKGGLRIEANVSIRPNNQRIRTNDKRIFDNNSVSFGKNSGDTRRIILKDESYQLMKLLFEIHNKLGPIYKEKNYQDAIEEILKREKILYEREKKISLKFENLEISDFFVDFVINNQILLEIKATKFITQEDIRQTLRYIKTLNIPLGIIVNFRRDKLEYKRLINPSFDFNSLSFVENLGEALGTKVEVKNLNSFRAVKEAIKYEIERQGDLLNNGKRVIQETRGWNESKGVTVSQRLKEEAFDYRYFPEPDLPPLDLSRFDLAQIKMEIPELPKEKRLRFVNEYSLTVEQVEILVRDRQAAKYFEEVVSELKAESDKNIKERIQLYLNYFTSDLKGLMMDRGLLMADLKITPENFAELINLIFNKKVSSRTAKDILAKMAETGVDPSNLMEQENLTQVSDEDSLKPIVEKIIKENPQPVSDYKKGKINALQFLVGKAMAELKGKGNPEILRKIFEKLLSE